MEDGLHRQNLKDNFDLTNITLVYILYISNNFIKKSSPLFHTTISIKITKIKWCSPTLISSLVIA